MNRVLTRRDTLKLGAAAAALPLLPRAASQGSFSFAYYSDTHVSLNRNVDECRDMIREIRRTFAPDFAINGGDVTDYGWAGEYERYKEVLQAATWPTHHIPGNHEVRWSPLGLNLFRKELGPEFSAFEHLGVHFILLDTTVPLSHWGSVSRRQLDFVRETLQRIGQEDPVFIAVHHWPGREGEIKLENELELLRLIEPYNIKIILTGHGHSDLWWEWSGIPCTMNKGLYQGSWQRITVDREAQEVRVERRTTQRPRLTQVAKTPLHPRPDQRKVWRLGELAVGAGVIRLSDSTAKDFAWKRTDWAPIPADGISTKGLDGGWNQLQVRAESGRIQSASALLPGGLEEAWSAELDGAVMSQLLADSGRVYVSTMSGGVYAFDAASGRQLWRKQGQGYSHSSPRLHEGRLYVGSSDETLRCFDALNGKILWTRRLEGPVYSSAAFAQGLACIADGSGRVHGLNAETGETVWTQKLPPSDTAFCQSPAASDGTRFYLGAWDSHLYALDAATGRQVWRRKCCPDKSFHYSAAIGGPLAAEGKVVVPANGNILYCFDGVSGETVWEAMSPGDKVGYSSPRLHRGLIVIGCLGDKGEVRAFRLSDGSIAWTAASGEVIYDSSPAVAGGLAAILTVGGLLFVTDAETGEVRSRTKLRPGLALSSPAMEGGLVFAATYNRRLAALRLARIG